MPTLQRQLPFASAPWPELIVGSSLICVMGNSPNVVRGQMVEGGGKVEEKCRKRLRSRSSYISSCCLQAKHLVCQNFWRGDATDDVDVSFTLAFNPSINISQIS